MERSVRVGTGAPRVDVRRDMAPDGRAAFVHSGHEPAAGTGVTDVMQQVTLRANGKAFLKYMLRRTAKLTHAP